MGCDISLFIELDDTKNEVPFSGNATALAASEIMPFNIGRNYRLFAALAGVKSHSSIENLVTPRGIPDNISWELIPAFFQPIKEELENIPTNFIYCWHEIEAHTRSEAQRLVDRNEATYNKEIPGLLKANTLITQQDAHTFGWLLLDEIKATIEINNIDISEENFPLIIDLMELIEKKIGVARTRLLFYFRG